MEVKTRRMYFDLPTILISNLLKHKNGGCYNEIDFTSHFKPIQDQLRYFCVLKQKSHGV